MTESDDGRAQRLAGWIREMDLADQVFITGTTLVLEGIRARRSDLPVVYDEAALRERTPREVYRLALDISAAYADLPEHLAPDGVDEHWRISNMTRELAGRVARYHPEVVGGAC